MKQSVAKVWTRVGIMVIAFIGVIYVMKGIRQNPAPLDALFNPESSQKTITRGSLNLCPTRVSEVLLTEPTRKVRYYQNGAKWLFEGPSNYEISPLFMEKWLAQNCEVKIDAFEGQTHPDQKLDYVLRLKLVNGTELVLGRVGDQIYVSQGELIKSSQLEAAVRLLDPAIGRQ